MDLREQLIIGFFNELVYLLLLAQLFVWKVDPAICKHGMVAHCYNANNNLHRIIIVNITYNVVRMYWIFYIRITYYEHNCVFLLKHVYCSSPMQIEIFDFNIPQDCTKYVCTDAL